MYQNRTIGANSNFRGSDFQKVKSSRTLGQNEYNMPNRDPEFLGSNIGRQLMRKSAGGATAVNNYQETVHSDNLNSYQFSGGVGQIQHPYGEELLSLGSGGAIGEPTITSGATGAGAAYLSSGVLGGGGVFQGQQPPRSIMTAGGGSRPQPSIRQNKPNGNKRLLTSQGPSGHNARKAQRASLVNPSFRQPATGSIQPQNRVNYSLQQPSLGIQGKGSETLPRLSGGNPLNLNITYNTTHINVPK